MAKLFMEHDQLLFAGGQRESKMAVVLAHNRRQQVSAVAAGVYATVEHQRFHPELQARVWRCPLVR